MIHRKLQSVIEGNLFKGKAIILIGARQVGKSTLFNQIIKERKEAVLTLNCDEPEVKEMLTNINTPELKMLIGSNTIVVIDEAQRVPEIGLTLKRITDNFVNVQLLVTGSSSFELQSNLNEPFLRQSYMIPKVSWLSNRCLNPDSYMALIQILSIMPMKPKNY